MELLKLLEYLEEETGPSGELYRRQMEIMEKTAERLNLEPKEIGWLCNEKKKRREKEEQKKEKKQKKEEKEKKEKKEWN